jgi:hypothetical protein
MSKKSKSNSLLNDMSYLNIGDLDVSKKGSTNNPKHRYEKNEKGSAPSFPNDGFYFNGQTVYPDEQLHQQQQPKNIQLTKDDFVFNPAKNKNASKGGMAHMIADEANAYHEDQEEEDEEAEDYDDGQEGAAGAYYPDDEEIEKNIKAPEMPNEFYQEIDHFLKKPPPKFQIDDPKNKKKKKTTETNNSRTQQQQQPQLQHEDPYFPPIHQTSYDLYQQEYKGMGGPPRIPDEEEQEQQSEEDEEEDEYYQQQQQQQYYQQPTGGKPPKQQQQQQQVKKKKNNPDQVYQNPINPHKSSKPRSIDPHLLKEAFAYTDQLLREAVIEEANSMINDPEANNPGPHQNKKGNKQPKSAPSDMNNASRAREMEEAYQNHQEERKGASHGGGSGGGGGSKKKSSSNKMGIVRNLKQQQSQQQLQSNRDNSQKNLHSSGFSVNTSMGETEGRDYKSNPVNYEDLVYNFQHGVNLDKLRRELSESKSSLASSEQLIRDLSSQFLRKK